MYLPFKVRPLASYRGSMHSVRAFSSYSSNNIPNISFPSQSSLSHSSSFSSSVFKPTSSVPWPFNAATLSNTNSLQLSPCRHFRSDNSNTTNDCEEADTAPTNSESNTLPKQRKNHTVQEQTNETLRSALTVESLTEGGGSAGMDALLTRETLETYGVVVELPCLEYRSR